MGFWETVFGRSKPSKPQTERFFDLATAEVTLQTALGWRSAGRAGLCLKMVSSGDFAEADREATELVQFAAREMESGVSVEQDPYGYRWFVISDTDFGDLVTLIHMIAGELIDHGYGSQLLAAAFRFRCGDADSDVAYLIYSYKRGSFYPFVPRTGKQRANELELRAGALLGNELPWEGEITRWYALWDLPV